MSLKCIEITKSQPEMKWISQQWVSHSVTYMSCNVLFIHIFVPNLAFVCFFVLLFCVCVTVFDFVLFSLVLITFAKDLSSSAFFYIAF